MSCIWMEALGLVNICNQIIQKRDATLDAGAKNINELLNNWRHLAEKWTSIVSNAEKRSNSHLSNEEKLTEFQKETFDKIVSAVENGIEKRFQATKQIVDQFDFLWTYKQTNEKELEDKICRFASTYPDIAKDELIIKAKHLKAFHDSNFGIPTVNPLDLLNKIKAMHLKSIFPKITIALRIFLTLLVTVASAKQSFSKLKLIKNYLQSIIGQKRLVDLAILGPKLGLESDLAKSIDFNEVIDSFASKKARRVLL